MTKISFLFRFDKVRIGDEIFGRINAPNDGIERNSFFQEF